MTKERSSGGNSLSAAQATTVVLVVAFVLYQLYVNF